MYPQQFVVGEFGKSIKDCGNELFIGWYEDFYNKSHCIVKIDIDKSLFTESITVPFADRLETKETKKQRVITNKLVAKLTISNLEKII